MIDVVGDLSEIEGQAINHLELSEWQLLLVSQLCLLKFDLDLDLEKSSWDVFSTE